MMRCGTDLVYIPALVQAFKDEAVLKKFFHASELGNGSNEHLAGVLAAKEAFFKAMGIVPKFLDIEISYEPNGRPFIKASPKWQKFTQCDISISHDGDYAVAMVVLENTKQ